MAPQPRQATPADAEHIVRMRSAYILSTPLDEAWIARCTRQLADRLSPSGDARAFVIDAPAEGLAASALGLIHPVLPAPEYPQGLAARIHAVATAPDYRRRGCARSVLSALLDRLHADGATLFELHASDEAAPLYTSLGFSASPALMRMTRLPGQYPPVQEEIRAPRMA